MKIDLSGRTALVTGASRGIGEATARKLAELGANVVLAARSAEEIERIAGDIGASATCARCDVSRYAEMARAVSLAQGPSAARS